jgi:hypothetical protein
MKFLQKAKQVTEIMEPHCVCESLFNSHERAHIVDKFYNLYNQHTCNDGTIPKSMYQIISWEPQQEWSSIYNKVVEQTKDDIWAAFEVEYFKIFDQIERYHKQPIANAEHLNWPGFSLWNEMSEDYAFWHTDTYHTDEIKSVLNLDDPGYIQSYTIPLVMGPWPVADGIYYDMGMTVAEINHISKVYVSSKTNHSAWQPKTLEYSPGNMYTWEGNIPHSVYPLREVSMLHPRLTIQCFGWVTSKETFVFW